MHAGKDQNIIGTDHFHEKLEPHFADQHHVARHRPEKARATPPHVKSSGALRGRGWLKSVIGIKKQWHWLHVFGRPVIGFQNAVDRFSGRMHFDMHRRGLFKTVWLSFKKMVKEPGLEGLRLGRVIDSPLWPAMGVEPLLLRADAIKRTKRAAGMQQLI